jgi:hypothetical protein
MVGFSQTGIHIPQREIEEGMSDDLEESGQLKRQNKRVR